MNPLLLNVLLALGWVMLTGSFSPGTLLEGLLLGYAVMWLGRRALGPTSYFKKVPQVIGLVLFMVWELVKANVRVALIVISPALEIKPGIVAVPLDLEDDLQITLLANLITLTPGTLSLDISDDRCTLFVHAMVVDDPDALRRQIKEGFERRIWEVFN